MPPNGGGFGGEVEYRVYTLSETGHIESAKDIACADDDDAIERVRKMVDGRALELWRAKNFLGRFEP